MKNSSESRIRLFRLRVFEQEWLRGFIKPSGSSELGGVGEHMLNAVLAIECRRWFDLGRHVGYFDRDAELDIPRPDLIEEKVFFRREALSLPPSYESAFAFMLIEARAGLTRERQDFLRLMFFADQREWDRALRPLQRLAGEIRERHSQVLPERTIDAVSWAFSGAVEGRDLAFSPAAWRTEDPFSARLRMRGLNRALSDRWDVLESARSQILEALIAEEEARLYRREFPSARPGYRRLLPPTED